LKEKFLGGSGNLEYYRAGLAFGQEQSEKIFDIIRKELEKNEFPRVSSYAFCGRLYWIWFRKFFISTS
jgi:hypothetical protein